MLSQALAEFSQFTTSRVYQVGGRGASATISRYTSRSRGGTLKCWYPLSMWQRFLGTSALCRTNALALPVCIRDIRQFPQPNRDQPAAVLRDEIVRWPNNISKISQQVRFTGPIGCRWTKDRFWHSHRNSIRSRITLTRRRHASRFSRG